MRAAHRFFNLERRDGVAQNMTNIRCIPIEPAEVVQPA